MMQTAASSAGLCARLEAAGMRSFSKALPWKFALQWSRAAAGVPDASPSSFIPLVSYTYGEIHDNLRLRADNKDRESVDLHAYVYTTSDNWPSHEPVMVTCDTPKCHLSCESIWKTTTNASMRRPRSWSDIQLNSHACHALARSDGRRQSHHAIRGPDGCSEAGCIYAHMHAPVSPHH